VKLAETIFFRFDYLGMGDVDNDSRIPLDNEKMQFAGLKGQGREDLIISFNFLKS